MQKQNTMVNLSEWTFDKHMNEKDLHPSVVKFCACLPIYRLKVNTKDWMIMQGNGME